LLSRAPIAGRLLKAKECRDLTEFEAMPRAARQ
jgi:hypothetical protein